MRGEPVLGFLVGAQVVQDDVDLPVSGLVGNDLVHEGLKVGPLLGLGGLAADNARGNLQRGEQVDRAVALVGALHALDDLAAAGLHVASRALQRLDRSEEHTSELQSLMRISYAVFCLTKKQSKHDT